MDGYTFDEAAERLGITTWGVIDLMGRGRLQIVTPGVLSRESVDAERERRDSRSMPRRTWERILTVLRWMP